MEHENEIWKDIAGYEGFYQISSLGRLRRLDRLVQRKGEGRENQTYFRAGAIMVGSPHSAGYRTTYLSNRKGLSGDYYFHRLVADAFIPNPENKPTVNHINGVRNDNRVENLEWATQAENNRHSFDVLGRHGSNHGKTIELEKRTGNAACICTNIETGEAVEYISMRECGKALGVQCCNVSFAIRNNIILKKKYRVSLPEGVEPRIYKRKSPSSCPSVESLNQ